MRQADWLYFAHDGEFAAAWQSRCADSELEECRSICHAERRQRLDEQSLSRNDIYHTINRKQRISVLLTYCCARFARVSVRSSDDIRNALDWPIAHRIVSTDLIIVVFFSVSKKNQWIIDVRLVPIRLARISRDSSLPKTTTDDNKKIRTVKRKRIVKSCVTDTSATPRSISRSCCSTPLPATASRTNSTYFTAFSLQIQQSTMTNTEWNESRTEWQRSMRRLASIPSRRA